MEAGYLILDHPADLGIEARGRTLAEAFEQAARGLISVIVDPDSVRSNPGRWSLREETISNFWSGG